MGKKKLSRREFVRNSGLAALGFMIVPRHVLGGPGYTPPSEQLTRGVIGTGGMGRAAHVNMAGAKTLAVCDVDANHLKMAMDLAHEAGNNDVKAYRDFREVLERPDIDVIHAPVPPHWHALVSIAAAQAGKDIWCEKPMTRTIGEGKRVVEAVHRNGRMFRINTGFRFGGVWYESGWTVEKLKKIVANGLLGWPVKLYINDRVFIWKLNQWSGLTNVAPQPVPPELDYNFWLGPAPFKPYHPHRVHMSFRGYWDYDGGGLGDQGQHYTDPGQYILGKDDTSPVLIEAEGPPQHPDAVGLWYRIQYKYADGCMIEMQGMNDDPDAPLLEGPKGKVYPKGRSTIPDLEKKIAALPAPDPMESDFYECCRTRKRFGLNEDVAFRSATLINLGKIAIQTRRPLHFDPVKLQFINDEEANRQIDQPNRSPWHLS